MDVHRRRVREGDGGAPEASGGDGSALGPDADRDPIVVTAVLDAATQARFDAERAALFPAGRTAVGAHLTLFHAVPAGHATVAALDLAELSRRAPLVATVTEVMPLGRGVAYRMEANGLVALHRELQRRWWRVLTAQDRQGFRAHVTVQNKVSPATARATLESLHRQFEPFLGTVTGLAAWRYRGGPWEAWRTWPFDPDPNGEPEPRD